MSLAAQATPLIAALERLGPHDHLCSIYESPQDHYAVAIPFIRIGLDRGEKCIYIADDGTIGDVRQAMESEGIDVERATATKALVLSTKEQAYLEHGTFDPDWMFTFWRDATQLAMSEGFCALRATGETEWVLRGGRGLERWMEYESRLTTRFRRVTVLRSASTIDAFFHPNSFSTSSARIPRSFTIAPSVEICTMCHRTNFSELTKPREKWRGY